MSREHNIYRLDDSRGGDFHHLTLADVARYFPAEIDRIRRFESFALVREPHGRLISAFAQRLKQVERISLQELGESEVRAAFDRVMAMLDESFAKSRTLPPELVHFQPQWDYVALDGRELIGNIYRVQDIDAMFAQIGDRFASHGETAPEAPGGRINTTQSHRFEALRAIVSRGGALSEMVKQAIPASIKPLIKQALYTSGNDKFSSLASQPEARAIVERHYADDLGLWNRLNGAEGPLRKTG